MRISVILNVIHCRGSIQFDWSIIFFGNGWQVVFASCMGIYTAMRCRCICLASEVSVLPNITYPCCPPDETLKLIVHNLKITKLFCERRSYGKPVPTINNPWHPLKEPFCKQTYFCTYLFFLLINSESSHMQ